MNTEKITKIQSTLDEIAASLCSHIAIDKLRASNSLVHKYKAPFRTLLVREASLWRFHDLIQQSIILISSRQILGARILLRSAYETLAILVCSTDKMRLAIASINNFVEFSKQSAQLALGSKNETTPYESINILTMIKKMDKKYSGIEERYKVLCESAHPNYDGMLYGYSVNDENALVVKFENRWHSLYGKDILEEIESCLFVFVAEYNEEWTNAFTELELWMNENIQLLDSKNIED